MSKLKNWKLKKKLQSKKGFSFAEMLVVLLIMSLTGAAITVGISTAATLFNRLTLSSNASSLCTTLAVELADELRFAKNVATDSGGNVSFTSYRHGPDVSIGANAQGRIEVGGNPLLSEKMYGKLKSEIDVEYDLAKESFTVRLTALNPKGEQLRKLTFEISPLSSQSGS